MAHIFVYHSLWDETRFCDYHICFSKKKKYIYIYVYIVIYVSRWISSDLTITNLRWFARYSIFLIIKKIYKIWITVYTRRFSIVLYWTGEIRTNIIVKNKLTIYIIDSTTSVFVSKYVFSDILKYVLEILLE